MANYTIHDSQPSFSSLPLTTSNNQPKQIRTVKISNIPLEASARDIRKFFISDGDIEYIEMHSDRQSQIAFVTFKDSQGADSAILLSGKTLVDSTVTITSTSGPQLLHAASLPPPATEYGAGSSFRKAEDAVSSLLAKGYVLSKDAISRAKSFDEKHQLTHSTSAKFASLNQKIGLSEKVIFGASVVNSKVQEVDQKLHVSEKVKSAYATAGQTVSGAGSAIMSNEYVYTGASWVTGAFDKVSRSAGEVGKQTKERLGMAGNGPITSLLGSPKASNERGSSPSVPSSDKKSN